MLSEVYQLQRLYGFFSNQINHEVCIGYFRITNLWKYNVTSCRYMETNKMPTTRQVLYSVVHCKTSVQRVHMCLGSLAYHLTWQNAN